MDERNTSCEEEIITGLSLEELKQEPLIDLLFGHRYKGATWLPDVRWKQSNDDLRDWVAYRVKFFSGSIQRVCFEVYRDFTFLVYNLRILKLLAEKQLWDSLPRRGHPEERELLLSKYNTQPNCQLIIGYAATHAETAVAVVARDGWKRLDSLAEHILDARKKPRKALRSLVETDGLLEEVRPWPNCVKRCSDWLGTLKATSRSQGASLEDIRQLIVTTHVETMAGISREGEATRETVHKEGARTRGTVETEAKKVLKRKRKLDSDNALVQACLDMRKAVDVDKEGAEQDHRRPKSKAKLADSVISNQDLTIKTSRFLRLYDGQDGKTPNWFKLGCPDTGEKYAKAKEAAKKERRRAKKD